MSWSGANRLTFIGSACRRIEFALLLWSNQTSLWWLHNWHGARRLEYLYSIYASSAYPTRKMVTMFRLAHKQWNGFFVRWRTVISMNYLYYRNNKQSRLIHKTQSTVFIRKLYYSIGLLLFFFARPKLCNSTFPVVAIQHKHTIRTRTQFGESIRLTKMQINSRHTPFMRMLIKL